MKIKIMLVWFITAMILLVSLSTGCDIFYQVITFENQTSYPVQADIKPVSHGYSGNPGLRWNETLSILKPGQFEDAGTTVPNTREEGIKEKYIAIAIVETGETIFLKSYTWDELRDSDWTVIIEINE